MTAEPMPGPFLRADWRHLAMLNYPADAAVLERHVPAGTELDLWQGRPCLTMVGFLMLNTRVRGIPVPFHRHFAEVNLRTYVRRRDGDGWRRGVVFIKEIVPRWLIAFVARTLYNENYVALPMRHRVALPADTTSNGSVRYEWFYGDHWHALTADISGEPAPLRPGSEEEFITEHYWGYCRQRSGATLEYRVEHAPWRVWAGVNARLDCDVASVYGAEFAPFLASAPTSAFVADGSAVVVRGGVRLQGVRG